MRAVEDDERRGRLIALEGVDGCGKTTQAHLLAEALGALYTFEPGDTDLGGSLRALLLGFEGPLSVRSEALLMAADRAQHVDEVVAPALFGGRWVVTDRFNGSTLAYQGAGRGLGTDALAPVLDFATAGLEPDLSVLIDVPVELARQRVGAARRDRLESLGEDFFARVAEGYRVLARGQRWVVIDGGGSIEQVAAAVLAGVSGRLGRPPAP
jgi:dTMP kinase